MNYSSKLLEQAVDAFASLPGVGRKSALRYALHVLNLPIELVDQFTSSISHFRSMMKKCEDCGHLADERKCTVCLDSRRDKKTICVVESIRDVLAIEATNQYFGIYHVLGGIISPIDGMGPEDLSIDQLMERMCCQVIDEIIMAIRPTIEGDTTSYYIARKLEKFEDCKFSTISRGISFGGELEFTDELTLGRSITGRLPYNPNVMLDS